MTAEERADQIVTEIVGWLSIDASKYERIVFVIRAAEDEALARAAQACLDRMTFHSYAGPMAANIVRSLKSGGAK
jgi:hypothetical protein